MLSINLTSFWIFSSVFLFHHINCCVALPLSPPPITPHLRIQMAFVDTLLSFMQTAATLAVMLLTAAGGLLYWNQTSIIYPANMPEGSRENVDTPDKYGMKSFEDLSIRSSDGVLLRAHFILQKDGSKRKHATTILYCHANAGNMVGPWVLGARYSLHSIACRGTKQGHRLPIARVFYEKLGCNVLMFSYRG